MTLNTRFVRTLVGVAALGALAWAPLTARQERQQPASPPQAGTVISKKDPLRFTAFGVNMQRGFSGTIDIGIERWTTDAERSSLLDVVAGTKEARSSQDKLVSVLQDVKPRAGYIRSARSVGWDIMYARENMLPDGTRQIVIVTDKPVSFWAASTSSRTMDYPFTMVEMRFAPGSDKGEGKLLNQTSISTKNGRLELEIYGQEPTRLTQITQQKTKAMKEAEKAAKKQG